MKVQVLMTNKLIIEPNSETERYAIMKLLDCVGDEKLRDIIEVGNENIFKDNQNG